MIVVTLGTNEARFDRLLRAVAELELDEEIVVQHGHSRPISRAGARLVDFLPFEELAATIRSSRAVVTHAGVGSVMVALANGKRPVVVPRRKAFGEAVDDHQLQLGRRLASAGLVTLVEQLEDLPLALRGDGGAESGAPASSALATDIGVFLDAAIASRAQAA